MKSKPLPHFKYLYCPMSNKIKQEAMGNKIEFFFFILLCLIGYRMLYAVQCIYYIFSYLYIKSNKTNFRLDRLILYEH